MAVIRRTLNSFFPSVPILRSALLGTYPHAVRGLSGMVARIDDQPWISLEKIRQEFEAANLGIPLALKEMPKMNPDLITTDLAASSFARGFGKGEVNLFTFCSGTYIVVLKTEDGFFFCSDSRGVVLDIKEDKLQNSIVLDDQEKIYFLNENIAVGYAGSISLIEALHKTLKQICKVIWRFNPGFSIRDLLKAFEYCLGDNPVFIDISAILVDRRKSIKGVMVWNPKERQCIAIDDDKFQMTAIGSDSSYAGDYINYAYYQGTIKVEKTIDMLCRSAKHVFIKDPFAGGTFTIFYANKEVEWNRKPIKKFTLEELVLEFPDLC